MSHSTLAATAVPSRDSDGTNATPVTRALHDSTTLPRKFLRTMFDLTTAAAYRCCWLLLVVTASVHANRSRTSQMKAIDDDGQKFISQTIDQTAGPVDRTCCGGTASTVAAIMADERSPQEIPVNVILELNQVRNVTELFTKFMPDTNMREAQRLVATTGFQGRSAFNVERKGGSVPKPAGCSVEVQTTSLKDTDDPTLYYYPPCTRVNRCGGCCAHDLLACQPTKIETLNFEVMVSQYNGAGKLEFKGRKSVSVIQHSKCKCDCVVKQENCNELQTYYPNECRCLCNNEEDRDKCNDENNLRLWNHATCRCECRTIQECTTGNAFDYQTCRCEVARTRTRISPYDINRNTYSTGT